MTRIDYFHAGIRRFAAVSILLLLARICWGADIGALCILTPRLGVLNLSAPTGTFVSEIPVLLNQQVRPGAILMSFSNRELSGHKLAALKKEIHWHERTRDARNHVQELILAGAEQNVHEASERLASYEALPKNARSTRKWLEHSYELTNARHRETLERARLAQMRMDDEARASELREKKKLAEIELDSTILAAPMEGTVLAIHKRVGEAVGGEIAVTLANLQAMAARCEVFEGDLLKLRLGMKARVSGGALPRSMDGVVGQISRQVHRDNKVAEILVHLDEADPASRLIGMEVDVTIMDAK